MFPNLRPFADSSRRLLSALREIGQPGGLLDAKDDLAAGPVALIVDPALSVNNPNNPTHTAGTTFIGQFLDHDLTFDLTSRLGQPTEPTDSPNERTPALDLDSVYGGDPLADPELCVAVGRQSRERPTKLKIERGPLFEDLPRRSDGTAIIADPRNDENLVIAGLQAAVILFHNKAVDLVSRDRRDSSEEVFRKARQLTTWHYQWMIVHEFLPLFVGQAVHEFLPLFVGQAMVDDILRNGRRAFNPSTAFIPSNSRGRLTASVTACRSPRRSQRPNKIIDTRISAPLFNLPLGAIASGDPPTALPQRNLLRHVTWQLPSGQSIARELDVPALSSRDFLELKSFGDGSTPLWYYVLREAQIMANGLTLGPVGGRIVGKVFLGLLQLDRDSYFSERNWRPTLPTRSGRVTGDFRMVDFLAFAGVDPAHRGQ